MMEPEQLTQDLDRMIELKREGLRGDPHKEARSWAEELAKLERMRDGYHGQAAEGLMSLENLREKLATLEERQQAVERELEALKGRSQELEQLERDRDAVLGYYAQLAPHAMEDLEPEEGHHLYKMLGLKVWVNKDGQAWAEMPIRPNAMRLEDDSGVYRGECMPRLSCTVRRFGDYEGRTEEYEISYAVGDARPHGLRIKYQAARAYEINASLDAAVETARVAISEADLEGPTDEALSQFTWRVIRSAKYEEGEARTSQLEL